ncbi:MAG: hypothetical protein GYA24_10835 [Candidatus Lokiarchaeota archaeon]|nr:hypothetical protein [Candidatus Lokiarchaeota archaeon]
MQKKNSIRAIIALITAILIAIIVIAFEETLIVATGLGSLDPATLQLVETILAIIIGLAITTAILVLILFTIIKIVQ